MAADFDIISAFLLRFEPADEVIGRGLEPDDARAPAAEIEDKLQRFARGECSPEERLSLCRLLDERREWLDLLAGIVRGLPAAAGGSPPSSSGAASGA
ncbi:MAG: hypothetical protein JO295_03240 [Verrucomicrobia bacterium]|nr:hypothetical protein [Verrucomicrobiota bacterium]